MESENAGRRFNPHIMGLTGPQSRFRYGIHFSNAPSDVHCGDLEALFTDFGPCRVMMNPGARHGWVGYESMQNCNEAFAGMNPNVMGMYFRKGPYKAGPMLRPPMGGSRKNGLPMGRPLVDPMIRRGPPRGNLMMGVVPPRVAPFMGSQYPRNYGPPAGMPCGARPPPEYYDDYFNDDYYNDDYYDYYGDMPFEVGDMPYGYPLAERPGCAVGPCTFCGVRTSYSCERCGAFYCSENCQRQDWSTHRDLCDKNIPGLNFGPRSRGGSGHIQDVTERMQRLPAIDSDGRGDGDRSNPRRSGGAPEGRSPSGSRPNGGERSGGKPSLNDRLQGSDRQDSGFKGQRRTDSPDGHRSDNAADRRDTSDRRRRYDDQSRSDSGFPPRDNDRQRRNDGDNTPRRNENDRNGDGERRSENGYGDRRGDGDSRPMGERRNESGGFNDRRGDGDRRQTVERRNEGGFNDRHGDGERRNEGGFNDRRNDGDRRPMGERRNEGGFNDRRPMGERRNDGGFNDRRPMGERRNDGGFNDRRGDGDHRPMGEKRNENGFGGGRNDERRPTAERLNDSRFGDRRGDNNRPESGEDKKSDEGPKSPTDNVKEESTKSVVSKSEDSVVTVPASSKCAPLASLLKKVDKNAARQSSQSEMKDTELPADKCIKLKVNDPVVITHAVAIDSIHVTRPTSAFTEEFVKVLAGVAAHCQNAPALDRAPAPNEVVACQFVDDNEFYRAVLKEVLPGEEYVMEFCDFGNEQKCKIDKLRAIPEELKKCPYNAVKVSLRGVSVVPISGEIKKFFRDLIDNEVKLKIQFDGDISKGVELIMPNGDSVNKEVAMLIGEAERPKMNDTPARKTDSPTPTKHIPASTSSAHVPPRSPEQVLNSLLTKVKLAERQPPTTYPAEEGICTQLENDELVVITASTNTGSTYITRVTESSELQNLSIRLNEHCKTAPPLGREPRQKEVVACLYELDELYYRAVVNEVLPNGVYSMVFIDYGNIDKYKSEQLKAIPQEMKMLPRQAVKVSFRDVDPVPVTGSVGSILAYLSNESTQLKLRFDGSIENGVELIKPDGKSVNEELRMVIAQAKAPKEAVAATKDEAAEDFSPSASVPLPSDTAFTLLVFGILGENVIAGCDADAPELAKFEETYAPLIAEYCKECPDKEHKPAPGEMCLAKYGEDWYRALCLKEENGTQDVFFVDYGNTHTVSPSDIRKTPQNIKSQLHLLCVCSIVGLPESPDPWPKMKEYIQSGIDKQQVAVFKNVTAKMTTPSTADITIPDLRALLE